MVISLQIVGSRDLFIDDLTQMQVISFRAGKIWAKYVLGFNTNEHLICLYPVCFILRTVWAFLVKLHKTNCNLG